MDEDQQFCLRWNNHQNTLISVFDNFLESETLVDCTLAAEGQYLKAHKVVLMACSPYLETLLNQHHDMHPILIMKDVKFQELKAMLQYMYRGEVVISPDQIPTFLKAAESLQIKGLTGSDSGVSSRKKSSLSSSLLQSLPRSAVPHSDVSNEQIRSALQIIPQVVDNQPTSPLHSGDGSVSPILRKRRRTHRPSSLPDDYSMHTPRPYPDVYQETSNNSCDVPPVTVVHSTPVDSSNVSSAEPSSNLAKEIKTEDQSLSITDEDGREQEDGDSSNGTGLDDDYRDMMSQAEPGTSGLGFASIKEELGGMSQDTPGLNQNQQDKETQEIQEDDIKDIEKNDFDETEEGNIQEINETGENSVQKTENGDFKDIENGGIDRIEEGGIATRTRKFKKTRMPLRFENFYTKEIPKVTSKQKKTVFASKIKNKSRIIRRGKQENMMKRLLNKSDEEVNGVNPFMKKIKTCEFCCNNCGALYQHKASLVRHQKFECGIQPQFYCALCDYRGKHKGSLKKHIINIHLPINWDVEVDNDTPLMPKQRKRPGRKPLKLNKTV